MNLQREATSVERGRFVSVCAVILLLCLALKLPSLFFSHEEMDERVFWTLSENLLRDGSYNLHNTSLLPVLSVHAYDRPLFHHPPLYAAALMPFVAAKADRAAVLVSWLGHALSIVGVAMMCWSCRRRTWGGYHLALWLPVLGMALDPLFAFCGRKLWADALVGGLVGVAMGCWALAARACSIRWAWAGGGMMALAALTKLPALLVLPAGAFLLAWAGGRSLREAVRYVLAGLLPVILAAGSWLVVFRIKCGAWLADWARPDETMIRLSEHVERAVHRPWHYFLGESAVVTPVCVVVVAAASIQARRVVRSVEGLASLVWLAVVVVGLTAWGLAGQGMQLRFLTIAFPAAYSLMPRLLSIQPPRRSMLAVVCLSAILYGAVNSGFYLLDPMADEIRSVPGYVWFRLRHGP